MVILLLCLPLRNGIRNLHSADPCRSRIEAVRLLEDRIQLCGDPK